MMILNEKKYAKDLLLGKNTEVKSVVKKIGYITRYNAQVLKKDDNENYTSTVLWMSKHQDNFDEPSYSNVITKAIRGANKYPLYEIEHITISKQELEKIKSLNNIREEKISFVLLCMAKQQSLSLGFTDGLVKYSITELCKMARVSIPADDREYILHSLLVKGLISCPKKNDTKCLKINFIEDDDETPELILNEIDCQELAYAYLKWKDGTGFKRCLSCGRLMQSRNKNSKCPYCEQSVQDIKVIWCIDCGDVVEINEKDTRTDRCESCYAIYRRKSKAETMRNLRSKLD